MQRKQRSQATAPAPALDIASVIAAFSEEQVERMTGLSKSRLRYWARTNFFQPSFIEPDTRLPYSRFYSFKDIVALRTLEVLRVRNNVPLQHLRRVADKLSHLKDDLWTSTTLFVVNREVNFVNPETGQAESVLTGQLAMDKIVLTDIINDTKYAIIEFTKRRENTGGLVSRHRSVARNAWVIAGTRIPIQSIKRLHEDGYSIKEIICEYPDLNEDDVMAAIDYNQAGAA